MGTFRADVAKHNEIVPGESRTTSDHTTFVFRGLETLEPRLLLSSIQSDDFSSLVLNDSLWQVVNPFEDGTLQLDGTNLLMTVPEGTSHGVWASGNNSVRIMQQADNEDFEIEVKFDAEPSGTYAENGVIIQQDLGNFLRFDFHSSAPDRLHLFAASFVDNSPSARAYVTLGADMPQYMRIKRDGNHWTQSYSFDGQLWTQGASFDHAMTVTSVGPFVGNEGTVPPEFTASVDYFFNTASPIIPEDGGDTTAPEITNVSATPTESTIQLNLSTNEPASIRVEYGLTDSYELGQVTNATLATSHSFTIANLQPDTQYHYRIIATDLSSNELISQDFIASTTPDLTAPEILNPTVDLGETILTVHFDTNELTTAWVEYGLTDQYELGSVPLDTAATSHSAELTGLDSKTMYHYRIHAVDVYGNESASGNFTATTLDLTPPQILNQYSMPEAYALAVYFDTDELATAVVEYGTTDQYEIGTVQLDTPSTFFIQVLLEGLEPETTYHYRIIATDLSGNQTVSQDYTATTLADVTAPVILFVDAQPTENSLWVDVETNEQTSLIVAYGLTDQYEMGGVQLDTLSTSHTAQLEALQPSTTYHFKVVALDKYGNYTVSPDYVATTNSVDLTPPVVQNLTATSDATSINIQFDTDEPAKTWVEYGFTTGYELGTLAINDSPATAHVLTITGLTAGSDYHFRIVAEDEKGNQSISADNLIQTSQYERVDRGLVSLFSFDEVDGNTVHDVSGVGNAWDLTIDNPANVTWGDSSLTVDAPTLIQSTGPASKLTDAILATNELTIEAWITPANLNQSGPARIISLSLDPATRNFTVGQGLWGTLPKDVIDVRLRTTATTDNGQPSLTTDAGTLTADLTHIVYTRGTDGTAAIYINGVLMEQGVVGGDLSNWDPTYAFALANELTGDRPWLGTFHLAAIYSNALTQEEVTQNYMTGLPPDTTAPTIVSQDITADETTAQITLQADELCSMVVEYGVTTALELGTVASTTPSSLSHNVSLEGLNPLTQYFCRITVTDNSGNITQTQITTFDTLDLTPPELTGVLADQVDDTWAEISLTTNEAAQATILYGLTPALELGQVTETGFTEGQRTVRIEGLSPDTLYYFKVTVSDTSGNTTEGTADNFSTLDTIPPEIVSATTVIGETDIEIHVDSNEPTEAWVEYGLTESYELGSVFPLSQAFATQHTFQISGLDIFQVYHYRIHLNDTSENVTVSQDYTFRTDDNTPPVIIDSQITDNTGTAVEITFETDEATHGTVEVTSADLSVPLQVAYDSQGATITVIRIENLLPDSDYSYRIIAEDLNSNTTTSQWVDFHTADTIPPEIIDVQTQTSDTLIHITITTDEPASIWIAYGLTDQYELGNTSASQTGENTYVAVLENLQPDTPYHLQVIATDGSNNTTTSADMLVQTDIPDLIAPSILNLSVVSTETTLECSLETDEIAFVTLEYGLSDTYELGSVNFNGGLPASQHQTILDNLQHSTTYHYRITATDLSGNPTVTEDMVITTLTPDTTPPVIGDIQVIAQTESLEIGFTTDEPATAVLEYGITESLEMGQVTFDVPGMSHSTLLQGLTHNTTYYYRITATDEKLNTAQTDILSVQTEKHERVQEDLAALYTFTENGGSSVNDVSGAEIPWNLTIADPTKVSWNNGALTVLEPTIIQTTESSDGFVNAVKASNALTIELWITPANLEQWGPSRIFTLSQDSTQRNFTIGQGLWGTLPKDVIDVRLRTTETSTNGQPSVNTPSGILQAQLTHVVYTRDASGVATIYLDGQPVISEVRGGTLDNWDMGYVLALANEITQDRPWLGTFHLAALYSDALTQEQVSQNFVAGLPPDTWAPKIENLVTQVMEAGAYFAFNTNEPATAILEYGLTDQYELGTMAFTTLDNISHFVRTTGLDYDTTYHYRITAQDEAGNKSTSGDLSFTTPPPDLTPPVLSNVTVATGGDYLDISFSTDEIAVTSIEYGLTDQYELGVVEGPILYQTEHIIRLDSLLEDTTYHYRITVEDVRSNSATSEDYVATTQDVTPPQVSGVVTSLTDTTCQIEFMTDEPATAVVQYGLTDSYEFGEVSELAPAGTAHAISIDGLKPGTTYHYRILATDVKGNMQITADATMLTPDTTPPVIENLHVETSLEYFMVNLQTDEPVTIRINYGLTTAFELGTIQSSGLTYSHSVKIPNLQPATDYYYRIVATDSKGNQLISGPHSAQTDEEYGPEDRVIEDLVALYTFEDAQGSTIHDVSGVGQAWDLTINNPSQVSWSTGSLSIHSSTVIASTTPATKLLDAVQTTNELTIETWITPASVTQTGPARILTLSQDYSTRNFTVGQGLWGTLPPDIIDVRLRTTETSTNGLPSLTTPGGTICAELTHIVYTRDDSGNAKIYINGMEDASGVVGGDMSNWDESFVLALGNEPTGDRPWLGTFHLVAFYDNALSETMVTRNYLAGLPPDTTPPEIEQVTTLPEATSLEVHIQTNEPTHVEIEYGLTDSYEIGKIVETCPNATMHLLRMEGLLPQTTYKYRIIVTDASGNTTTLAGLSATTTVLDPQAPDIDIWYGSQQQFGQLGNPQPFVNILGNVSDEDGVASLSYQLNGGPEKALSMGPNLTRLEYLGDFNVDIHKDDLLNGLNTVMIKAVDTLNNISITTVTIDFKAGQTWSLPYTADWSSVTNISEAGQIVDGLWMLDPSGLGVRPVELGYDRLIAIGDVTWKDYEITLPITVYGYDPAGFRWPSNGAGLGVLMRWQGHYDWDGSQPYYGWWPMGATAWYGWSDTAGSTNLNLNSQSGLIARQSGRYLQPGVTYTWRIRVETRTDGLTRYSLKVWEGSNEPDAWDLTGVGPAASLTEGSILIVAHHADALFGNVTITPL